MSTSDDSDVASALGREIERLANEYFTAGTVGNVGTVGASPLHPPAVSPHPPAVSPLSPPNALPFSAPSALAVGGGGLSPSIQGPPIPGAFHQPPLAATPIPKESDLRNVGALIAEPLGTTPIALVSGGGLGTDLGSTDVPYFLTIAGPPADVVAPAEVSAPLPSLDLSRVHYEFQPELVPEVRSTGGAFDANAIKRDFPILSERVHGRPLVWLDNAATTQKPRAVIDRLVYFYEHENSNIHRAAHTLAARATDAYEAARDKVRRFLNAPSPKEIVFTRGATEAINLVAQSFGRRNVNAGDEIVITWLEHHANIVPWQQLCAEKGARLRVVPVDSQGQVILEEYEKLLGPRTRLVSLTQVSNALGTIVPAREMVAMAHRHGARVLVDGAQAVSHMAVDVQALDCDFYVFSGHKVFAPTGIGVLFGKTDVLDSMPPWQGGGNMIADVTFEKTAYQPPPARFEAGTGNIADAVGLGAAIDYVSGIGMENIRRYEHELLAHAERELARVPGLRMIGTAPDKAGVLSFVIDGLRNEDIGAALDQEGIATRSGHHCAQPILRRFGLEGTVRASLAPYNTYEDIAALVSALLRLQTGRPSASLV